MFVALLSGCASAEKMLERGNYDQLISMVTKKMAGKKKKDKYVKALEVGFDKMIRRDMGRIESLRASNTPEDWERIIHLARDIRRRQELIEPYLPLVSDKGYQAKFTFVRADEIIREAIEAATSGYEDRLERLVKDARSGDKFAAREAYDLIGHIASFNPENKRQGLRDEMRDRGTNIVLIKVVNDSRILIPGGVAEELLAADFRRSGNSWERFYTHLDNERDADYIVSLKIVDVATTREEIREHQKPYSKDIVDGWDYVLDHKGNVMKDSIGNDIKVDKLVKINATLVETVQTKNALVRTRMEVFNTRTGNRIRTENIELEECFVHTGRRFYGDERALDNSLRSIIPLVSFPTDAELISLAFQGIKSKFVYEVRRINFPI